MTSRFWWLLLAATPAACSRWQRPPPALKFAASTGAGGGGGGGGEFWDGQHAHAPREWYANATVLLPLLRPLLQPKDDILHVGCGTSTIGSMLFNEGFVNIVETDKSHVALAIVERQARALTSTRTQIQRFLWSDATALPETFPPAQFDAVLDKGYGRVDNIMAIHSLNPTALAAHNALYTSAMTGTATLRKVEREMIALVVSLENHCHY